MSDLKVGDIIRGYYVDMSPRFYKIVGVTPMKVKVLRLKFKIDTVTGEEVHSDVSYGDIKYMTKIDTNKASHYGMICERIENAPKVI